MNAVNKDVSKVIKRDIRKYKNKTIIESSKIMKVIRRKIADDKKPKLLKVKLKIKALFQTDHKYYT